MTAVRLRPLTMADLPAAQVLSAAVGWPHRLEDWQFVAALGEGLVAEAARRVVATGLTWAFGGGWSSLGMVIVAPELQGQGIGRKLMQALLPRDGGVVLHASRAGAPLYRTLGFAAAGLVRQHQGAPFSVGFHAPRAGERIRPAGRADLPVLAALDLAATGMGRAGVLAALLDVSDCIMLDRQGVASGFAMLRRFGRGQLIGPIVAPDAEAARLLAAHWLGQRQGEFIRIDVTEESGLSPWLAGIGLAQAGEVLRMVRGAPPAPAAVRGFALASQALG